MSWRKTTAQEARQRAQSGKPNRPKLSQEQIVAEQAKLRQAQVDKAARLRALRLAKESEDREAAAQQPPRKKTRAARSSRRDESSDSPQESKPKAS